MLATFILSIFSPDPTTKPMSLSELDAAEAFAWLTFAPRWSAHCKRACVRPGVN